MEVRDNLVDSGGKLKKERMVDEFDIIVEKNLMKISVMKNKRKCKGQHTVTLISWFRAQSLAPSLLAKSLITVNCWRAVRASSACSTNSASVRMVSTVDVSVVMQDAMSI